MAQLEFTLANKDGLSAIFITNDAAMNVLTLWIKNVSGKPLTLEGGAPVAEESIGKKPAAIYLTMGDMLDATHFKDLRISSDGWKPEFFPGALANWGLFPINTITLAPDASIVIKIENVIPVNRARPGKVTIDYFNLGTVPKNSTGFSVTVQNPPIEHKELKLNSGVMGSNFIDVSVEGMPEIKNSLTFYLSNPSRLNPIVPEKTDWGKDNKPVFNLFFAYGNKPGYTELCTLEQLKRINVEMAAVYKDAWSPVPMLQGSTPYWELQPKNHDILAPGGIVMFNVTNIVTYLEPGPTMLFLQYANIPGYDDGVIAINLFKQLPFPTIDQIKTDPPAVNIGDSFQLTWKTYGGDYTLIPELGGKVDPSGVLPIKVTSGTQKELVYHIFCGRGTPAAPVKQVKDECRVAINPPAVHMFTVSAGEMALFGLVEITWSVSSVESCQLFMGDALLGQGLWGRISIRIVEDTTFTLVCKGTSEIKQTKTVKVQPVNVETFTAVWTPDQKQTVIDQRFGEYIRKLYPQWDGTWNPWMAYALEQAPEYFIGTLVVTWKAKFATLLGVERAGDSEFIYTSAPVETVKTSASPIDTGTRSYHGTSLSGGTFRLFGYGRGGQYYGLVMMEAKTATPPLPGPPHAEMELIEQLKQHILAEKTSEVQEA